MEDAEETNKMLKKRGFVVKEIISTEVTYIERLRGTVDSLISPIRESKALDAADLKQQFETFEQICELHSKHLSDLQSDKFQLAKFF